MNRNEAYIKARGIAEQLPGRFWRPVTANPNRDQSFNGFAVRESLFNPLVFKVCFESDVAVVYLNDKFLCTEKTVPEAWAKAVARVTESVE